MLVLSGLRHRQNSVVELDSFDDVDEVMSSLEYGSIVVSQKRTEKGLEYLVPWTVSCFEACSREGLGSRTKMPVY